MSTCTNCSHTIPEPAHFCNYCGQSTVSFERPFKPVFTDMIHETLDIDGRMIKTFKMLVKRPGQLSLEYCKGKRMMFTPPLRMYLVISIIFFLLWPVLYSMGDVVTSEMASKAEQYPKIMFCLLPVFALILQMLFKKTYYLSNLIFAIHFHCIVYLVFLAEFALTSVLAIAPDSGLEIVVALLRWPLDIYLLVYCALALKRNYGHSWRSTLFRYAMLILIYLSVVNASVVAIMAMVESS